MRRGDVLVVVNFGEEPAELSVDPDLDLVFRTPSRPTLADGVLHLPAHAGALLAPETSTDRQQPVGSGLPSRVNG